MDTLNDDDDDNYQETTGGGRMVLCGDKSSWGSGTPAPCLTLWSCVRSMCPGLLHIIGKRPPTVRACVIVYGAILHVLVWYFFTAHKSGCMSMPSLRGATAS